jgi:hypothetical protein
MRRLITLIFADRDKPAVMVVIRRELPRTKAVGLAIWSVTWKCAGILLSVCPPGRCLHCFTEEPA